VTCAVSGGADSSALLILAVQAGLAATAVHIDHGIRPGGDTEADAVRDLATRLGAGFRAERAEIRIGGNLEARARTARFELLPPDAMTGHTADDHAETVLINLLRGAGPRGLAGIRPGPTKPLLQLRRQETRALCAAWGVCVFEDPSNDDPAHLRNRVRHELLPLAGTIAGRDLVPILTRQASLWRDDDELLDSLAGELDPTDARALAEAPRSLARRAVRHWLTTDHPPDAATVERVLAVAHGEAAACELPGGERVSRHQQRLRRSAPAKGSAGG
jgi:tRNA(Ile)-lysidine synthase